MHVFMEALRGFSSKESCKKCNCMCSWGPYEASAIRSSVSVKKKIAGVSAGTDGQACMHVQVYHRWEPERLQLQGSL